MTEPARLVLKPRRAEPFFHRHPWVFAGAVGRVEGTPPDGGEVEVVSHTGAFIARGLYNGQSKIVARLYCWEPDRPLDRAFFRERLSQALTFRERLGLAGEGQGYRLCNSEADGLSGCTIDVYAGWAAAQFTALGVAQRRAEIAEVLGELIRPKGVYLRTERGVGKLEGLDLHDGPLSGEEPPDSVEIEEHGIRFSLNLREGQKTGFYLDQRANRAAVAGYAGGRRALDAFCYSGGFALNMARGGATSVLGLDGSEPALGLARANAERNGLAGPCEFRKADVFAGMNELAEAGERFGMVVLDPPKFARGRSAVPEALRGYRRLLSLALRLLEADGILVMCCCSGLITAAMIEELLAQVAVSGKRTVQLIERRGADVDHPVSLACRESEYLKCLILRVI